MKGELLLCLNCAELARENAELRAALEGVVAAAGSWRSDLLKLTWSGKGPKPDGWSEPDIDRDKHLRVARAALAPKEVR